MIPTSQALTEGLSLTPVDPQHGDLAFAAKTLECPWPKAYGGDLVAQAAVAAMRSVGDDRSLHSMHSYFLRPAQIGAEIRYEVELLRDGRGYSSRQVRAYDAGKLLYTALASFHAGEAGGEYQPSMPEGLAGPEELPSSAAYLEPFEPRGDVAAGMTKDFKEFWSYGRNFDMRHIPGPVYLSVEGGQEPHQALWIRTFDRLRPVAGLRDDARDLAALAWVCDCSILEPVLRVLGRHWCSPGLVTASLDHAMWFHRAAPMDDWLLYAQQVGSVNGGRGLGVGQFFTRDGILVATVAQEGVVRSS